MNIGACFSFASGVGTRIFVYVLGLMSLFGMLWASADRHLANATFGDVFILTAAAIGFCALLYFVFKPSKKEKIRLAWGEVGLFMIFAVTATVLYFTAPCQQLVNQ